MRNFVSSAIYRIFKYRASVSVFFFWSLRKSLLNYCQYILRNYLFDKCLANIRNISTQCRDETRVVWKNILTIPRDVDQFLDESISTCFGIEKHKVDGNLIDEIPITRLRHPHQQQINLLSDTLVRNRRVGI